MKKIISSFRFVFPVLVFLAGTLLVNASPALAGAEPDLIAVKTNNVSNTAFVGHGFTWSIHITSRNSTASFNKNKTIFTDNLPSSGATYSNFRFTPTNIIGGTSDLSCTLSGSNISCFSSNNGNGIDIPTNGSIDISVLVTPTAAGNLVNPKSGGICKVDPNNDVNEGNNNSIEENNNTCSNTVTVSNPAHIVVTKDAIPNNAQDFTFQNNFGNGNPSTFLLDDDSNNTLPKTRDFEVLPGTYSVSEDQTAGWKQGSQTCTGNGNTPGNIAVGAGETVTCTFTNKKLASIALVKNTVGGDGIFNFNMTGATLPANAQLTTINNTATQTFNNIDPDNTYSIAETVPVGWDLTNSSCTGTNTPTRITPNNGETITCTFTNTKRGSITVHEDVVAPDGATDVSDNHEFNVTLNGENQKSVSENSDVEYDNLTPGTYAIAEIGDPDFDLLRITAGNVIVTAGQNTDVIITNRQKQGSLTVIKIVNNPNGGAAVASDFIMKVKGTNVSNPEFPGGSGGVTTALDPGSFEVSESGPNGYSLISSSKNCSGSIGSNKNLTCAMTNSDIADGFGAITVKKHVINDNGGTATADAFAIHVENEDEGDVENSPSNGSETGTLYTLLAGTSYTIRENEPISGYALTGISCEPVNGSELIAGGTSVTLELSNQQAYVCVITNDDIAPKLHLRKVVVNDNGGIATTADFTLTGNGTGSNDISGISPVDSGAGLKADTFALSESNPGGYIASNWSCVGGTQDGSNITLGINQEATCTITNDDIPAPIISEETTPVQELTTTSFTTTWTTDHPATSRVIYDTVSHSILGEAPNYGYANSTTEDATLVISHSVTVSGLIAGTVYFYRNISHGSPESVSSEKSTTTTTPSLDPVPTTPSPRRGGGHPHPENLIAGQVLGASTEAPLEAPPIPIVEVPNVSTKALSETAPVATGEVLGVEKFIFTKKIKLGSKGNEVTELEKALSDLGLYKGAIDGKFGKTLRAAIKAYQKANPPLKVDGIVGAETRAVLNK